MNIWDCSGSRTYERLVAIHLQRSDWIVVFYNPYKKESLEQVSTCTVYFREVGGIHQGAGVPPGQRVDRQEHPKRLGLQAARRRQDLLRGSGFQALRPQSLRSRQRTGLLRRSRVGASEATLLRAPETREAIRYQARRPDARLGAAGQVHQEHPGGGEGRP